MKHDPAPLHQAGAAARLAAELVRCPSITPQEGGAQRLIENRLNALGFVCERMRFSQPGWPPVDNLYARRGTERPFFCFAGHSDVVPAGAEKDWRFPPFAAQIEAGRLYGRGVSDMKGGIAAFIAAAARFLVANPHPPGSIGLLITGDEEGPAVNGTAKMLARLHARGEKMDACVVGEPTNPERLGQEIKIGRRGSLNGHLILSGQAGHAAWPGKARNPLPRLVKLLDRLTALNLDSGSEHFAASHLALTSIDTGNAARNVIPPRAEAKFNIRFNDHHTAPGLQERLETLCRETLEDSGIEWELHFQPASVCFINPPGRLAHLLQQAAHAQTGRQPAFTTTGGTSDARFLKDYVAELAEFGLVGASMHKVDEYARLDDIETLSRIYEKTLIAYFASARAASRAAASGK